MTITILGPYEYQNGDYCNITEMAKVGLKAELFISYARTRESETVP
jgi:hypothetical protein